MTNLELKEIVARVVKEKMDEAEGKSPQHVMYSSDCRSSGAVEDLSALDFQKVLFIPNPANEEEYLRIKAKTGARLGVGRCGPRALTKPYLRFRADHAAAMDAVFNAVSEDLISSFGLVPVTTRCESKDEYLTRPDLGRLFSPETSDFIRKNCEMNPDVQIIVSDGLSSTAVNANLPDLFPALLQGLSMKGIRTGTPLFVKYGRVGAEDAVTELVKSKVTVILLGERPGLVTSESLSAYMTYGGYVGIPEASRTVVSNIHQAGTGPVEAGAHISDLIAMMLQQKASGLDLKE